MAAILLPPLGVFLRRGLGGEFWIAVVLTVLGWLPGVIWSLFVVTTRPAAGAAIRVRATSPG